MVSLDIITNHFTGQKPRTADFGSGIAKDENAQKRPTN